MTRIFMGDESSKPNCIDNLHSILQKATKVAIFTHNYPDSDAISSMMGVSWLLEKKYSIESKGFFNGEISHPQNLAMTNLLDPNMGPISEYDEKEYDFRILVDTIPQNAGIGDNKVNFDLVIDHHREVPNGGFNGLFINLKAGSCAATVYHLIRSLDLSLDHENDNDSKVATALMIGISTDTESLMSDDTTDYEFRAWSELFELRDSTVLKKVVHFERPKFWIDSKAGAVNTATYILDGVVVVGLGIIPAKHRDMIADMSDEMVTWEGVNTSVAFAVVEGDRIEGCVRSRNATVMVPSLCKELAGKHGSGGGKLGKGAYRYSLGGFSLEEDEDDETINKMWDLLNQKETKRIQKVIRK